MIEDFYQQYWA